MAYFRTLCSSDGTVTEWYTGGKDKECPKSTTESVHNAMKYLMKIKPDKYYEKESWDMSVSHFHGTKLYLSIWWYKGW
jgi:hypothetical protein